MLVIYLLYNFDRPIIKKLMHRRARKISDKIAGLTLT